MKSNCSSCIYAHYRQLGGGVYFSVSCTKNNLVIDHCTTKNADLIPSFSCPLTPRLLLGSPKDMSPTFNAATNDIKLAELKKWENITPTVKWEDVQEHTIYHVPPYKNTPRFDIEVTYKTSTYFLYKKLGDYEIKTATMNDTIAKVMVKSVTKTMILKN